MAQVTQADILSRFKPVDLKSVKLLTDVINIKGLLVEESLKPETLKPSEVDVNSIYIAPTAKKTLGVKKTETQGDDQEEKQKVYRPGPFALFYELNENKLEKDVEAWYYKEAKEIIGPVSSYNMDKMVYFRTIQDETKVAFKSVDKFVKFKKIKSILEDEGLLED